MHNTSSSDKSDRIRNIEPFQVSPGRQLLARLVYHAVGLVNATLRWKIDDPYKVLDSISEQQVIFCTWHNRLTLVLPAYRRFIQKNQNSKKIAAIASASRDGALVAKILEYFGAVPVRGSSSRRGLYAMMELVEYAQEGFDLAITPDGPRGPKYSLQPGIAQLAQLTRLPILPVCYQLDWKITLNSWDRFQIPLPFSRCILHIGPLIHIPRSFRETERQQIREHIRKTLMEITHD